MLSLFVVSNSNDRLTDRQTDREVSRQTDRETDRETDRQADRQTDIETSDRESTLLVEDSDRAPFSLGLRESTLLFRTQTEHPSL